MDKKAREALVRARTQLLVSSPFFGCLALHLELVEATQDGVFNTMATDGHRLIYWPKFVMSLSEQELVGVVAHEVYHCFPDDAFIAGNYTSIKDVRVGDKVTDMSGFDTTVKEVSKRPYRGDLVSIKAKGMLPIDATPEHPFLIRRPTWKTFEKPAPRHNKRIWSPAEWCNANELKVGDWVAVPILEGKDFHPLLDLEYSNSWSVPQLTRDGVFLDEELAEFIGWYVAEGWSTKTESRGGGFSSGLAFGPNELMEATQLGDILERKIGCSCRINPHHEARGFVLNFSSRGLSRWLHKNCGAGAANKRIPLCILENKNKSLLLSFLKGYIKGDGHINANALHFGTVSKTLAMQLQLAFARFGFLINLHLRKPTTSEIRGKIVKSGPLYQGSLANADLLKLFGYQSGAKRPTSQFEQVGDLIFTPIRKISKRKYNGSVFNFETSTHTYTAGNVVVHNCAFQHMTRRQNRDPMGWNAAGDFVINADLKEAQFTLPKGHLFDPQFKGMSTEEVYARIMQDLKKSLGKGDGSGNGNDPGGCGGVMDAGAPHDKAAQDQVAREWEATVRMAVAVAKAANAGQLPGYLERLVKQLKAPKMSWRDLTRQFIDQSMTKDYSWTRPNRRFASSGLIMPGFVPDALHHMVFVGDVSGSVSMELMRAYLSEVAGALDEGTADHLTVIYADTQVRHVDEYVQGDVVECKTIGGGGTCFIDSFRWIKEHCPDAACICYLTDMMPNRPPAGWGEEPENTPVLWGAYSSEAYLNSIKVPFGQVVHIDGDT